MSAITGIFYRDGRKVGLELIKKMNDRLSHRGHDGSAVWCEGSIALGHQMLWTTPESLHEKLPFEDNESGLVITADARIDNRDELSKELDIEDKEEISDSYFILKAYQMWGEDCPDKLLGDFAFAIWDKNDEKLFCARDHMGVKPFYYYLDDNMFVFGTEIKALFCVPGVPRELNERRVASYLMKDTSDYELTFYENIMSLISAHSLIVKEDIKIKKYWKLNPDLQIIFDSENDYVKSFREIFEEAVKCRLRSYFPLGAELSGGLDSSSVACMARTILSEKKNRDSKIINTFSRIFDDIPECDERYYSKKVADMDGIKAHFINVDKISPLKNIKTILWQQDQPFYTPHMTKQIKSYSKIKENGIRILLSGQGGDEIVSIGKNYLRELLVTFQWKRLIREINGRSCNFNENKYKILLKRVIFPLLYPLKKQSRIFPQKSVNSILNKDFLKKLNIDEINYNNSLNNLNTITSKEYHYYSINYAYHEVTLGTIDRRVAGFNMEVRYPFYDKRLIEFCYALPTEMKLRFGWSKYILRLAMENILPPEIQWRPHKTDLSPSYKKNLFLFEKNTLKKVIYDDNELIKNYIDLETFKSIFKEYESGNKINSYEIWLVTLLSLWLKYEYI